MPRHIIPKRYAIQYGDLEEFEVRVTPADMLKAEETGPTYAITNPQTQAIAMTLMWLWAASVREGHLKVSWPDFRANVVDYGKVEEAAGEPHAAALDPTRPAGLTASPSPSQPQESEDSTSTDGSMSFVTTPAS